MFAIFLLVIIASERVFADLESGNNATEIINASENVPEHASRASFGNPKKSNKLDRRFQIHNEDINDNPNEHERSKDILSGHKEITSEIYSPVMTTSNATEAATDAEDNKSMHLPKLPQNLVKLLKLTRKSWPRYLGVFHKVKSEGPGFEKNLTDSTSVLFRGKRGASDTEKQIAQESEKTRADELDQAQESQNTKLQEIDESEIPPEILKLLDEAAAQVRAEGNKPIVIDKHAHDDDLGIGGFLSAASDFGIAKPKLKAAIEPKEAKYDQDVDKMLAEEDENAEAEEDEKAEAEEGEEIENEKASENEQSEGGEFEKAFERRVRAEVVGSNRNEEATEIGNAEDTTFGNDAAEPIADKIGNSSHVISSAMATNVSPKVEEISDDYSLLKFAILYSLVMELILAVILVVAYRKTMSIWCRKTMPEKESLQIRNQYSAGGMEAIWVWKPTIKDKTTPESVVYGATQK